MTRLQDLHEIVRDVVSDEPLEQLAQVEHLAELVDSEGFQAGWRLATRGRVTVHRHDAGVVRASVHDSSEHSVTAWIDGVGGLEVKCNCAYMAASDGKPCQHAWAVLCGLAEQERFSRLNDPPIKRIHGRLGQARAAGAGKSGGQPNATQPALYAPSPEPATVPEWQNKFESLHKALKQLARPASRRFTPTTIWEPPIHYVIEPGLSKERGGCCVRTARRRGRIDGTPGRLELRRIEGENEVQDGEDRAICRILSHLADPVVRGFGFRGSGRGTIRVSEVTLLPDIAGWLVPRLCETGRCWLQVRPRQYVPLRFSDEPARWAARVNHTAPNAKNQGAWLRFQLEVWQPASSAAAGHSEADDAQAEPAPSAAGRWRSVGKSDTWPLAPLVAVDGVVYRVANDAEGEITRQQDRLANVFVPEADLSDPKWPEQVAAVAQRLPVSCGPGVGFETRRCPPRPVLKVCPDTKTTLRGQLVFEYDELSITPEDPTATLCHGQRGLLIERDFAAEAAAKEELDERGLTTSTSALRVPREQFPELVGELTEAGWRVEAEGREVRSASGFSMSVTSEIDWFDLHAVADFGDQQVSLPVLLRALKRGEGYVTLGDGTLGLLPEQWLAQHAPLAEAAEQDGGHLRFRGGQALLLDAMLADQPGADVDATFERLRGELRNFSGIQRLDPPETFTGELRPYQRDGLSWMGFLQRFRLGGCLADDMGLGKTIQVLAMLEQRRQEGVEHPSLIVVPRSLVHNWWSEAERFTPELTVLDHAHSQRQRDPAAFEGVDVVLTTYGTLRRDIEYLRHQRFDYAVLDESQAVKNPQAATSKAVRLIDAEHRLALSGTPIENHLGELWSLMGFLNPGVFDHLAKPRGKQAAALANDHAETKAAQHQAIARAVRPVILRRTKQQVAKDLPERLEQTLWCALPDKQRKRYNELREHYQRTLLGLVDEKGLNEARFQVLEGLLRLRQAACHPGLLDPKAAHDTGGKLEVLLDRLQELRGEGGKALVFSQFTSLLALVQDRLNKHKIPHEYLDGQTRNRPQRVERFQSDPDCGVFLISLKAGGTGLNLTAADHVFLLDPWWNPAVEAQAIDRAHRIGQTRQVFAFRLISQDTVEEKVLELQERKRALADAILSEDQNLVGELTREDLKLLLS